MTTADWDIHGPTDFAWTPTEIAQIARAAQAFAEALASVGSGRTIHLVRLHGVGVLSSDTVLDWPQPGDDVADPRCSIVRFDHASEPYGPRCMLAPHSKDSEHVWGA
jgi:hypothetical protein